MNLLIIGFDSTAYSGIDKVDEKFTCKVKQQNGGIDVMIKFI